MEPVKFIALDKDDLDVVSTHLQDALVKVADILWRPQEKRLVVALSRFDWLSAECSKPELRRCRAALRFERVSCCKCRNLNPAGKDAVLNLISAGGIFGEIALLDGQTPVPFVPQPPMLAQAVRECLDNVRRPHAPAEKASPPA